MVDFSFEDTAAEDAAARRSRFSSDQVRRLFSRMYFPESSFLRMMRNSQWLTLRRSSKYSTEKWYHFMRKTRDISPCVTVIHVSTIL